MQRAKMAANNGRHCQFWLPKKRRFCANIPLNSSSSFCGNHTSRSDQKWIPCTVDPSHSVLEDNLETHVAKCPLHKQTLSLSLQPYYQKGINAGTEAQEEEVVSSELKRQSVHQTTVSDLFTLIRKIKSIHASSCSKIQNSFTIPDACTRWTDQQINQNIPFQEKHARQQASILGNMQHFGILHVSTEHSQPAVVEFGAGRGYLTQMLADCYAINRVILVERKSYKLKADRSLRQIHSMTLDRLRIDIEDLKLNGVESLRGVSYLAIGKHLCGPATDMMLNCCIQHHGAGGVAVEAKTECILRGLSVATCCHHLCQWKHYINKKFMSNLGVTKEDFHAMTWFTSWAVDIDRDYDLSNIDVSQHLNFIGKNEHEADSNEGEAAAVIRNMSAADRVVLGLMCKDIIDVGRLTWLNEHGLHSQLVKYVPPSISPENHLLIASSTSSGHSLLES